MASGEWRVYEWEGLRLRVYTHPCVYEPSDDTRIGVRALALASKQLAPASVADLGSGTGILGLAASLLGAQRVIATDRNPHAVEAAARTLAGRGAVAYCDWAECLADKSVDLAVSNTPYLPVEDELEGPCRALSLAWSGSPGSVEAACRESARIARRGVVLVVSSLSGLDVESCLAEEGFEVIGRVEEAFFMERIIGLVARR